MDDLFYEIYNDLPRQGPGDAECTRRAFQSLPAPSAIHRILDVGCGAGLQTLEFARLSTVDIVAADNNPVVIETLSRRVEKDGLSPRVKPVVADMLALDVAPKSFDLLWSEGAIYMQCRS